LLVVCADPEHAERSFRDKGRVHWSAGLPAVLEKLGYLEIDVVDPARLTDDPHLGRYACAIATSMPREAWVPGAAEALLRSDLPALVEAPLPAAVAIRSGISTSETATGADGTLRATDPELAAALTRRGAPATASVRSSTSRPVDQHDGLHWSDVGPVGIDERRAQAWRSPGWRVERWSVPASRRVLAEWQGAGAASPSPALVRSGPLRLSAIAITSFLAQMHSAEPYERREHRNSVPTAPLEALLAELIDALHADARQTRIRVLPWPGEARWSLSVRHDVDRPLTAQGARRILDRHAAIGTAATWYWRSRLLARQSRRAGIASIGEQLGGRRRVRESAGAVRTVARARRQEVALHAELLWAGRDDERATVERVLDRPVAGMSAHGAADCFRFQGAPNVLWAAGQRLRYTELIQHQHAHPHRFVTLTESGRVELLDILCLPHHESFDRSMRPGDTWVDELLGRVPRWIERGGLLQVMNHPDLNADELFRFLASLPETGRLDWTAGEAAAWWRHSHVSDELTVATRPAGDAVEVRSASGVDDLALELLLPDGRAKVRTLSLQPGAVSTVSC
jgi:hypothetical protein